MTTNMSEVFNGVLKGARTLPITLYRLTSSEEFTPHIDAKIKAKVVKAGAHEVVLYDHVAGRFHFKTRHFVGSINRKPHTYHVILQMGSCTCYYTTCAYLSTWAPLFYLIFDELEWPQYNGPIIVPSDSMKRLTSGRLKSSCLYNEMDARETRTPQTCGLCKQSGHNRRSCPNKETNDRRS
ncbi:hypothetical protein AAG906_026797 [Vitis piasezkii]